MNHESFTSWSRPSVRSRRFTVGAIGVIMGAVVAFASSPSPAGAAFDESARVWSVVVEIDTGTGDHSSASLDKVAYVRLSDSNITWLDDPFSDLDPGGQDRYDLVLDNVRTIADIRRLEIGIPRGTYKDVCIRKVSVLINGVRVVTNPYATCRTLFSDIELEFSTPIIYSGAALRTAWAAIVSPARPTSLANGLLAGQLNTAVGHWAAPNTGIQRASLSLHADETVSRRVAGAVHVTSTLSVLVRGVWRQVVVDQDVRPACRGGVVTVSNANVTITGLAMTWDQLPGVTERVRATIDATVRASISPFTVPSCPRLIVESDGSISI